MSDTPTTIIRTTEVERVTVREIPAPGAQGLSGTMQVGTVTTLEPNDPATIVNVGTPQNSILNFAIPRGQQGFSVENIDGGRADSNYGGLMNLDGGGVL